MTDENNKQDYILEASMTPWSHELENKIIPNVVFHVGDDVYLPYGKNLC